LAFVLISKKNNGTAKNITPPDITDRRHSKWVTHDESSRVSATDTTPGFLIEKLSNNGNVGFTKENAENSETLRADVLPPAQVIDVALSERAYTSVAAAIAAITDASATKPYVVRVFPGVYTETPFSMKPYVAVIGQGSWYDVVLTTNNNSAHFISHAAGAVLSKMAVVGPTGAGYAAIDCQHTGNTPAFLDEIVIRKGYYGVWMHPASYGTLHCHNVVNQYAGTALNQFLRVTNGNVTALTTAFMSGPSAAVLQGFYVSGSTSTLTLDLCSFSNAGSTDAVFADNGAVVRINACSFSAGTNAIHIGATGTGTSVSSTGGTIGEGFTKDLWVETASATLSYDGTAHNSKIVIQAGATFSGTVTDGTLGNPATAIYGDALLGTALFPLSKFTQAYSTTGIISGGEIERVSGLQVKVKAGTALVMVAGNLSYISWADQTITLAASTNDIWIYVDSVGVATSGSSQPDLVTNLYLGRANTGASTIRFLSTAQVYIPQPAERLFDYVTEVIGPINVSGGVATKHAGTSVQLDVTGSTFYSHNTEKVAAASASPCSFTYWYRNGSGSWTVVTSQTSIDTNYYDDGTGTLAAITSGYYKRDLLLVAVNGSATEYHVVYGQELFAASVDAVNNPLLPAILLNAACRLAGIIVLRAASDIASIVDQRPRLGQLSSSSSSSSSITNHGDLSGLADDDHTQYQLRTEKGAVSGYCGLDATSKVAVANLNTATSAPGTVAGGAAAVGAGPKLAFENHNHSLSLGSPVALTVGGSSADGTSTAAPRADHVHALPAFGTTSGTIAQGNDSRFSDSRAPNGTASGDLAGSFPSPTVAQASGAFAFTGVLSPASITASQNNYAPTNLATSSLLRLTSSAAWNITGLTGGASGRFLTLHNIGSFNLTLTNEDAGSTAANRFSLRGSANHILTPNKVVTLQYDATSSRWRAVGADDPYGTAVNTVCQGNDSRLSDDRTAAGLRSATTVVSVSGATAPTTGQVLTATGTTAATWQTPGSASSVYKQSVFLEKTVDVTTTSTGATWSSLLSQAITLAGSTTLIIHFTAGCSNNTNNDGVFFRIKVDGTVKRGVAYQPAAGGSASTANNAGSVAMVLRVTGLAAGARTVLVEWQVDAGTGQIRPVAAPNGEHASLLLEEVSA
jgi:hypothetical protein